jgi:hypothetical protein
LCGLSSGPETLGGRFFVAPDPSQNANGVREERPVADPKSYTQEEVDAIIAERDAIKANRDDALTEAKKAKAALKGYEGIDPAEYKKLKDAADEAARKAALAEGNLETWKKQVTDQHQKERESDAKRIAKYETAIARRLKEDELRKALVGKADPTMMELLVEHGSKFIHVRETDDDFEHFVADAKGNPLVADGKGTPMDVSTFVDQRLKAQFPAAFLGSGSSGGGATKSSGSAGGRAPAVIANTNSPEFLQNLERIHKGEAKVGA